MTLDGTCQWIAQKEKNIIEIDKITARELRLLVLLHGYAQNPKVNADRVAQRTTETMKEIYKQEGIIPTDDGTGFGPFGCPVPQHPPEPVDKMKIDEKTIL